MKKVIDTCECKEKFNYIRFYLFISRLIEYTGLPLDVLEQRFVDNCWRWQRFLAKFYQLFPELSMMTTTTMIFTNQRRI